MLTITITSASYLMHDLEINSSSSLLALKDPGTLLRWHPLEFLICALEPRHILKDPDRDFVRDSVFLSSGLY